MKAILVIDMPTSCIDCPFTLAHICDGGKQTISDIKGRHESCPLKPLPERKNETEAEVFAGGIKGIYRSRFYEGWNACIDELKGETE